MIDHRSLEKARLEQEQHEGTEPKPKRPRMLALDALTEVPELFQMRESWGSLASFDEAVKSLVSLLRNKRKLDPVLVWWTGKRWVILDGHHRLAAYRLHAEATGTAEGRYKVFVKASQATTVEGAVRDAHEDNAKVRNPVHDVDRRELTWKLTKEDPTRSYGSIVELTGVSRGTAQNARKTYHTLRERGWSVDRIMKASWDAARAGTKDAKPDINAMDAADHYAFTEREADVLEEGLRKQFQGGKWRRKADAWAMLFTTRFPGLFKDILESKYNEYDPEMFGHDEEDEPETPTEKLPF